MLVTMRVIIAILVVLIGSQACLAVCPSKTFVKLSSQEYGKQYFPLAPYGAQPPFHSNAAQSIFLADPPDACEPLSPPPPAHSILLAVRGNCTFLQKSENAAAAQLSGLIILNNSSECLYVSDAPEDTPPATIDALQSLFFASAPLDESTQPLLDAATAAAASGTAPPAASFSSLYVHTLDPAAFVLLLLALTTLVTAAAWTGSTYKRALADRDAQSGLHAESPRSLAPIEDASEEQAVVTIPAILFFICMTSIMMFVLFFIINKYIFYIFVALFAYGSCVSCTVCLHAAAVEFRPAWLRRTVTLVKRDWRFPAVDVAAVAISVAAVGTWVIFRHAEWSWALQNALGMCFMAFLLQTVALPNAKVATVALSALFCYDVFMVFITPAFMPHGDSVMVRVATGGDMNEALPMLLTVPRLLSPVHSEMMLGYGDVVVPGLLIMMLRRFDVASGRGTSASSYTLWLLLGYVVGIGLTDLALMTSFGGSKGQPALLYLVPCTLGVMWVLAWARGDAVALWRGQVEAVKDHASGAEDAGEEEEERQGVGEMDPLV